MESRNRKPVEGRQQPNALLREMAAAGVTEEFEGRVNIIYVHVKNVGDLALPFRSNLPHFCDCKVAIVSSRTQGTRELGDKLRPIIVWVQDEACIGRSLEQGWYDLLDVKLTISDKVCTLVFDEETCAASVASRTAPHDTLKVEEIEPQTAEPVLV